VKKMVEQADKHLKMWLKCEEGTGTTLNDVLKTNNGTMSGGVSWQNGGRPARDGKKSLVFDGNLNTHCIVENSAGEVWNGSSSFTASCWVYRIGDNTGGVAQWAFVHAGVSTNNRIYINLGETSPQIKFNVGNTNFGGTNINNGQWYHVAVSHNTLDGKSYGYIDGKLVVSSTTALGTGTYDMFIGSLSATSNQTVNGYIDDVRFYSKFMAEPEIRAIMHGFGYSK
jgi:hypothetical protein